MHFWYVILKGGIFYPGPWGGEERRYPLLLKTPSLPLPLFQPSHVVGGINTAMISRFGSERSWLESFSSFYWANSSGLGSKLLSELIGSEHQPSLYEKTDDLAQKCTILYLLLYNKLPSIWRQTRCMNYFKHY